MFLAFFTAVVVGLLAVEWVTRPDDEDVDDHRPPEWHKRPPR